MIQGLEGSYSHSQNGMTRADMEATALVANRQGEVIIFRSTGPWAKRWLERGYPSKNFHVKGKSSDWGPQSGHGQPDVENSALHQWAQLTDGRGRCECRLAAGSP